LATASKSSKKILGSKEIRAWFENNAPLAKCPICQEQFFPNKKDAYIEIFFPQQPASVKALRDGDNPEVKTRATQSSSLSSFYLACRKCGYVMLFDRKIMGL
jgi:RNA polymerase subunit RPABC4/transcription elongation factor Spt4